MKYSQFGSRHSKTYSKQVFTPEMATRPLTFPLAGSSAKPIPIEVVEPDFNKAIAAVIWVRHHRQPTSSVFNCRVSNCPLCPPASSSLPLPDTSQLKRKMSFQPPQKKKRKTSEYGKPTVVNWLISSLPSSSSSSPENVASGRLRFPCPSCPMSFAVKSHLRVHRQLHNRRITHRSDACDPHFTSRSAMLNPCYRVHRVEQLYYRCPFRGCGKKFSTRGNLTTHYKIHV